MARIVYTINPNFRLVTPHLAVAWHLAEPEAVAAKAADTTPSRHVFKIKKVPQIVIDISGPADDSRVDIFYHPYTDFGARGIQKWLRERFRDIIEGIAAEVLPARVAYWENRTGLHGAGVEIKRLRKSILACCSADNVITLQPFLVLFKQQWADEIILHEMAHYRFKHHRRSFWNHLSDLLGHDARKSKAQKDIELSPYYGYCLYLTQK